MVGSSLELIPLNMHQAQQYPLTGREPATTSTKDSQDPIGGGWTRNMVRGKNRIPYWIDRRLNGLAGPEYHAIISFGLPIEPEDSQYGLYRPSGLSCRPVDKSDNE